jgi:hypothetical protein
VEILDDGALRFVRPDGAPVDGVAPGCSQPHGDASKIPPAAGQWQYRGDRMDVPAAVDLLFQCARKAQDVPAGTSARQS